MGAASKLAALVALTATAAQAKEWSVLEDMSVAQLSEMLKERGIRCTGCIEKEDFLAKLRETDVDMEVVEAPLKSTSAGGPRYCEIKYCMSCGYRKAFEDYARALHKEFPELQFKGEIFHPGAFRMGLAQILQMSFFGGLVISFVGKGMLPESAQQFMADNQLLVFGALFGCNIMSSQLINTGAFEVTIDGERVWSKMEAGRFPQLPELMQRMRSAEAQ